MDYIDRIGMALKYIEDHLKDEICLNDVAKAANSSLFWFHRIFSAVTGDSLGNYIRKRRLNRAAIELVESDRPIIDIAIDYNYSNHEAFTRAFRDHFAMTPSCYRKAGLQVIRRSPITEEFLRSERNNLKGGIMSTKNSSISGVRVIELPECKMTTSADTNLNDFNVWWSALDKIRTDKFYPRDFMYHDSDQNKLIWLYALPAEAINSCPYRIINFPGGLYASLVSIDGNDIDGERVYGEILDWIKNTGYFMNDVSRERPVLFHIITSDNAFSKMKYRQLEIYVPIK
jgi:AraC family transcriptional regulator